MGKEALENEDRELIDMNVFQLNQEFEGLIKFEVNDIIVGGKQAYIPELRDDHITNNQDRIESLILPVEKSGAINVFIFDTYVRSESQGAMLGFTPILSNEYVGYAPFSPFFDRVFVAYKGLQDGSTLVHEIGHFFNLKHPWEQKEEERKSFGITDENIQFNHMNYHEDVNHFTREQLNYMYEFAIQYRTYLIQRTDIALATSNSGV